MEWKLGFRDFSAVQQHFVTDYTAADGRPSLPYGHAVVPEALRISLTGQMSTHPGNLLHN
jgi:hypothetical protein